MSFVRKVVAFAGSANVHRGAAAAVSILTAVSGAVAAYGSGLGLDAGTLGLVVGGIGVLVSAAREVENPALFAFLLKPAAPAPQTVADALKSGQSVQPTPPPAPPTP